MTELLGKPRLIDIRNRVTLPPQVMKLLNLKPDDKVYFKLVNSTILMGKALVKFEYIDEVIDYKKS